MRKTRPRGEAATIQRILGENIRELRDAAGWNQQELADRADISRAYLSRIETGSVNVSLAVIMRIARVLGTTIIALLS